jgi:glycosyltransferase involved in cell wall biosynthesis
MRVAFWADMLYYRLAAGTTRYAGRLSIELQRLGSVDLRLYTLFAQDLVRSEAKARGYPAAESIGGGISRQAQYLCWAAGLAGPWREMASQVDLIHVPNLLAVPSGRTPLLFTVHDLTFLTFPSLHNGRTRLMAGWALRQAVRIADAFIADAEFTAGELVRTTGVPREKIHVIPLAADEAFRPTDDAGCLSRLGMYVGTLEPRKNLPLLLRAFAALERTDAKLVIAGTKGWMFEEIFALVESLKLTSRVIFTGFVPDADLPALLSAAEVFVYPSLHEGFGLPVLEAMQCGTPVITTNVSSLPEVAGDAALMVSPEDVTGLASAMRRVLDEPGLREEMRGRSMEQARRFSWRETAERTAEVYRQVAHPRVSRVRGDP